MENKNIIIDSQNSPIKIEKEIKTEYSNSVMTPDDKSKIHTSNSNRLVPNKLNLNFNSKYDDALLEELYNSKDKSWRNEISSASPYEDNKSKKKKYYSNQNIFLERGNNMNINNNISKNEPVKIEITSKEKKNEDRFKDFDDILNLEEPKVKKRKYSSEQKLISFEKYIKNSKPENNNQSFNDQKRKDSNITNLDVIKEVLEKDDKNKIDQLQEYKDKDKLNISIDKNDDILKNKNNFGSNINKKINFDHMDNRSNFLMNDNKKNYFNSSRTRNSKNNNDINNNYLNENTNTSNENNINKYTGINLEYSEDRRSIDEKLDNVKDEKDENNIIDKTDSINNFNKNNDNQNISNQENSIKNSKSIHYIDIAKTPSEKKINSSNNKDKKNQNYINFPKTGSNTIDYHIENYNTNKINNRMIDIFSNSKTKEKNKTNYKKGKNINLKKKIIYKSNTIHHIPLNKNFKINSASNSQKNIFDYLLEDDDDNKKTRNSIDDKNRKAQLNSLLYNHSTNLEKILKNKIIKSFYPIDKETIINNNNTINYNAKNQKIDRIKNIIKNINVHKNPTSDNIKNLELHFDFNSKSLEKNRNIFLPESNFLEKYKYRDKILENEKNKNSFFPNYKNYFKNRKYNNNIKLNNNDMILKYDDFFFRDMRTENKSKESKNNLFNAFSSNKNRKKKFSFLFKDSYNDDFFEDINTLNSNKKKNFIDVNKLFDYNKNKNNSQRGNDNYSFLSSSFMKKYNNNNSSFNFMNNNPYINKNKNNFSTTNRYKERNFQKYIENKGSKILSEIDNKFMKQKTSVLPANPFNFF
mgnify:CR=1 FL=1